jgi:hypothetical protein
MKLLKTLKIPQKTFNTLSTAISDAICHITLAFELLNFFSKTCEKFSIFYWNLQSLFNLQKILLNIQYFMLEFRRILKQWCHFKFNDFT